jgi:hypothetical protein
MVAVEDGGESLRILLPYGLPDVLDDARHLEKRASWGFATLLRMCQAMVMAMTMVLPVPVAILQHRRRKSPPSPRISMPTRSAAGASISQMSVSTASSWQKKNRRRSNSSGSRQCASSRLVMLVTPGYPASRQALTRGRIRLTKGISTKMPGSSNDFDPGVATTYPAGRRPSTNSKVRVSRS